LEKQSFENAMKELELIVDKLENGNVALEESLELFEKGIALSEYCSEILDKMQGKIKLLVERGSELTEQPFPESTEELE
jgi:exodeoxyribonuclease VII small subunit